MNKLLFNRDRAGFAGAFSESITVTNVPSRTFILVPVTQTISRTLVTITLRLRRGTVATSVVAFILNTVVLTLNFVRGW